MRALRTKIDWEKLYTAYKVSGSSITNFCKQHRISTSSFYLHKPQLENQNKFITAKIISKVAQYQYTALPQEIILNSTAGKLSLPSTTTPSFLIKLIKGLS